MMTNTTTMTIETLAKDQTVVLQTPAGNHIFLAKPLFNVLHHHFPDASFEVLETLLSNNAAYGLYVAKQHQLFPAVAVTGAMPPDKTTQP